MLLIPWIEIVWHLKKAFSREKSFFWFVITLMGFSTRTDQLGVSSVIRALDLGSRSYECLRHFFRSQGVDLEHLTRLWWEVVEKYLDAKIVRFNAKRVFVIDGIKAAKEGRRMAGVKCLFQGSQNNSKPMYIFGHSCQALHVLVKTGLSVTAVPLIIRIHEGLGNRRGSVVMRVLDLVLSLKIRCSYIVGDAYYWAGDLSVQLQSMGNHLISRVKTTAVAYEVSPKRKGRGRPSKYGKKVAIKNMFKGKGFVKATIKIYGRNEEVSYKEKILLCKNHQCAVKYVLVKHGKTQCIFASTDTSLEALEIIEIYSYRFKIEFSFKEFVYDFGGFCYRFWSKSIDRSRKKGVEKRNDALEHAYHLHIQFAAIAQGVANILSIQNSELIWATHQSWMRTIREGVIPSAAVTRIALQKAFLDFSMLPEKYSNFIKFINKRKERDKIKTQNVAA